jgi:hypothetical protein
MKATTSKKETVSKEDAASQLAPLFEHELRDIYWAEKALTIALPQMIKTATSEGLKLSLENHLEDAEQKAEQIFKALGREPEEKGDEELNVIVTEAKELLKDGSWCYERVTQSAPRRKRMNTQRIYSTKRFARSVR